MDHNLLGCCCFFQFVCNVLCLLPVFAFFHSHNMFSCAVRYYGEAEFWFAFIKVTTVRKSMSTKLFPHYYFGFELTNHFTFADRWSDHPWYCPWLGRWAYSWSHWLPVLEGFLQPTQWHSGSQRALFSLLDNLYQRCVQFFGNWGCSPCSRWNRESPSQLAQSRWTGLLSYLAFLRWWCHRHRPASPLPWS